MLLGAYALNAEPVARVAPVCAAGAVRNGGKLARSLPGAADTGIDTTTQLTVFYRFFP